MGPFPEAGAHRVGGEWRMMDWADRYFRTLYARITFGVVLVVLGTVLVNLLVVGSTVDRTMRKAQDEQARTLLHSTLVTVEAQHLGLVFHKQTALDFRKKEIRNVVEFALAVVREHHERWRKGESTPERAQEEALEALRRYRYDAGIGYIWVNNVDRPLPRILMHPILPELTGIIVDDPMYYTAYGRPIHLFKAFVDICLEQGGGYVDYLWPKPTGHGLSSLQQKVSYVELFPEWGWVIGSGLYIDDIETEVQRKLSGIIKDLNDTLGALNIGNEGYLFIFDGNGTILVHPSRAGQRLDGLTEPKTGRPLSDLFREAAEKESPVEYMWDKPGEEGNFSYRKRARVIHYKPLDWYIATTVYADEESEHSRLLLGHLIALGVLVLGVALASCLPLVQSLVGPITRLSEAADLVTRRGLGAASIPRGGTVEVRKLGDALEQMISSIRQSQQKLVENEEKYRSMMEAMEDMVFICSADSRIEYTNPAMARFVGRDVTGRDCLEALGEAGAFCSANGLAGTIDHDMGFRFVSLDGGRHFHLTSCPVNHPDGTKSLMTIIRDVSDQVRAESDLRAAQRHIQSIVNSMPSVIVGLDRNGLINLWNKEAAQIFGIPQGNALGRGLEIFPAGLSFMEEMFRSGAGSGHKVKKNKVPLELGGVRTYVDVTVYPLEDEGGAVVRIDDVSDIVRLEETMVQSEKMLSLGGLAAGMAHEINNPLAGIVQNAQVLMQRLGSELPANLKAADECGTELAAVNCYLERRRILSMIGMILESGLRAARIVRNMLSFVHKSADEKRAEDLRDLMDQTLELAVNDYDLKKNYDFRKIEVLKEYDPNTPKVLCDASKVQQVFMNLLKNGAQAMAAVKDRQSRFVLRIAGEGDMVRVEVEDNGQGMDEGVRKRVFEPLFTTKPLGAGTGLGLSVSYFIVTEQHGGSMRVESVPGKMARFIMHFPVLEGCPAAELRTVAGDRG